MTKHDGVQVDSILIDQAKLGEALRQVWASNFDLPIAFGLQLADRALEIILNKPGVGPTDFNERDSFGQWGSKPGEFGTLHHMASDSRGNLYVTEVTPLAAQNRRVQKFVLAAH